MAGAYDIIHSPPPPYASTTAQWGGRPYTAGIPNLAPQPWTGYANVESTIVIDEAALAKQILEGDWSDLKPAAWRVPGPLESGVFDRPEPVVYPMGVGGGTGGEGFISYEDVEPEFLPGHDRRPVPTDWDEFYEDYIDLNPEDDVAHDWGHTARQIATGLFNGGSSNAGPYDVGYDVLRGDFLPTSTGMGGGQAPPAKVTVDTRTGKVTPCRRARRKPLLTCTDLNTLAALKTIVGGGQALNFAVMKAVRR